jgi:hypothetical protein
MHPQCRRLSTPEAELLVTAVLAERERSCLEPLEDSASTWSQPQCRSLGKRNCRVPACREERMSSNSTAPPTSARATAPPSQSSTASVGGPYFCSRSRAAASDGCCDALGLLLTLTAPSLDATTSDVNTAARAKRAVMSGIRWLPELPGCSGASASLRIGHLAGRPGNGERLDQRTAAGFAGDVWKLYPGQHRVGEHRVGARGGLRSRM